MASASPVTLPSTHSTFPATPARRHPWPWWPRPLSVRRPLITSSLGGESPPSPPPPSSQKNPGGGGSWVSPDWLTSLARSLAGRDDSGIPPANAKLEDVSDLLGGALFLPLFKWMKDYGPVYRLAAGPRDFVVVSHPAVAKHVLRNYGKYAKGLVSEVSEFLFGSGFAIAEGQLWTVKP